MPRYEEADLYEAIQRIINAINNEGVNPEYHAYMIDQLIRGWPVMAEALKNLIKVYHGLVNQDGSADITKYYGRLNRPTN